MKHSLLWAAALVMVASSPTYAAVYRVGLTGTVQTVEGDGQGAGVLEGDLIKASFNYDDTSASGPSVLAIGGGTYTTYVAPLTGLSLAIGSYAVSYGNFNSSLTYIDDSFESDAVVFGLDGLPGGPFGSTFANAQIQARGPTTAIDGKGVANGLPYDRLTPSFFAVFGNGTSSKRIFGSLAIASVTTIPEASTWAMMIAGFGLMGCAVRSRRERRSGVRGTERDHAALDGQENPALFPKQSSGGEPMPFVGYRKLDIIRAGMLVGPRHALELTEGLQRR